MYLKLYRFLLIILGPFIDLYLLWRRHKGKEDAERFSERLGYASFPRPDGPLVWFHAASIGESVSILPLIQEITAQHSTISILLTTGTVTSANVLESKLPKRTYHHYVPVDKLHTVRRFLSHWKPDVAVFVESELWPNLILETYASGCPMIQVNARLSESSAQNWGRYGTVLQDMLQCFRLTLAQSEEDKTRLEEAGAKNAKYLGNLKFDAPPLPADPKETGSLISMIGDRTIWLAASTHPGEEEQILATHKLLKDHHADMLTIIVPRHPERGTELAEYCESQNLTFVRRTEGQPIHENTDVYLADTVGELGLFYRLSSVVFMGGSMVPHGGQNPLEAIRLDSAILAGPHTDNFAPLYQELEQKEALLRVRNVDDLFNHVEHLLIDHEFQAMITNNANTVLEGKTGILDEYVAQLGAYIDPLSPPDTPSE